MNVTQWFLLVVSVVLVVVLGWMGLGYVFSPSPESADRLDAAMVRHQNPLSDPAVTAAASKDKGIVEAARAQMARDLESQQEATRAAAIAELTKSATEPLRAEIAELRAQLAAKEAHNCELLRMVDSAMLRQPLQWPPVTVNVPPAPAPTAVTPVTPAPAPTPAPTEPVALTSAPATAVTPVTPMPVAPVVATPAPPVAPAPAPTSAPAPAVAPVTPMPVPAPTPAPPVDPVVATPATVATSAPCPPCPDVTR